MIRFRAYIANRVTDKLTKVTDFIYCCRSGSAADTQAIADIVNYHLNFHKYDWIHPSIIFLVIYLSGSPDLLICQNGEIIQNIFYH